MPSRLPRSRPSRLPRDNTSKTASGNRSFNTTTSPPSVDEENKLFLADLDRAIDNAIKKSEVDGDLASLETLLNKQLEKISRKRATTAVPKVRLQRAPKESTLQQTVVPKTLTLPLTPKDLLSVGLSHAGFSTQRQAKVMLETNIERFKGFYGLEPRTLVPVFTDVKNRFPTVSFKHLLITMNWLTLYDKNVVLSGRWGYNHDSFGRIVIECTKMIQSFLEEKIGLHLVDMSAAVPLTLDTVNFTTNEIRTDPNSKWYDPKSHSSGFKYEFCLSATKPQIGWINGPKPASVHDMTVFHGGTEEEGEDEWDREALYWQIPDGSLIITDSGYKGEPGKILMVTDEMSKEMKDYIGRAKARQETLNGRMKGTFNILGHRFRHNQKTAEQTMKLHQTVVHACAVLIQYDYENGHPPFPLH